MPRAKKKSKEKIEETIQENTQEEVQETSVTKEVEVEEKVDTVILNRSPEQFSKKFQTILYSEPKHLMVIGFYVVIFTAVVLAVWSYFSVVNKSYSLNGEVAHINPELSISPDVAFEFKRYLVYIGSSVNEGDPLFEYSDVSGKSLKFDAPITGLISKKTDLKRGVRYTAGTEVVNIRPEDKEASVKLEVPNNILNKVKPGNDIVYHFSFPLASSKQLVTGSVITEPVLENDKYVVAARIDEKSMNFLEEQKVKLIDGMYITAEIVVGRERLLGRFLGVKL